MDGRQMCTVTVCASMEQNILCHIPVCLLCFRFPVKTHQQRAVVGRPHVSTFTLCTEETQSNLKAVKLLSKAICFRMSSFNLHLKHFLLLADYTDTCHHLQSIYV